MVIKMKPKEIFEKAKIESDDTEPEISFKLFKGIEPIISRNEIVGYRFLYDELALDSEGKIFNPVGVSTIFDFPNSYTKEEIGLDEDETNQLEIIEQKNNEEFLKLLEKIKENENDVSKHPNTINSRRTDSLNEVWQKFKDWYKKNNITQPELKETADKETEKTKSLKLTPNKKEILNSKIIEQVQEFRDMGKGSFEKAYKELSNKSKKLFGYSLTAKQIEGRYKRNKDKHFQ